MADQEEALMEIEAVQSVYGDDCLVISRFPPHLQVHIKPRTAEISSQQFVEAVVGIKAGTKYPEEPPQVNLIDHKGLDEQRRKDLLARIHERAHELTPCLMLVALCEEAVERLSAMNHPEGNCPLCLFPLVPEDEDNNSLPFMKLMSCFHCFHSECIIRWWNWIKKDRENSISIDKDKVSAGSGVSEGNCPVCRKVFQTRDIEHVLNLVSSYSSELSPDGGEASKDEEFEVLESDPEKNRRQKFEAILKLQQEKNGLIEPKKDLVVMPGMFLPAPPPPNASSSEPRSETAEPEPPLERTNPSGSHEGSSNARRFTDNRKFGARRRNRGLHNNNNSNNNNNARKQSRSCWVRKEDNSGG